MCPGCGRPNDSCSCPLTGEQGREPGPDRTSPLPAGIPLATDVVAEARANLRTIATMLSGEAIDTYRAIPKIQGEHPEHASGALDIATCAHRGPRSMVFRGSHFGV